ncbi:HNH endonuclease [Paraburkholderia sp. HD33-4]|uniref:HNH endonuclease n=1 Tax=Paraburkholderia sp. HD33-4 TaxID=2883242 RepID=UPI001F3CCC96|nr:HNH endonuclease signature motif containing protein [Paraburkholderia sp. HD33-4]
MPRYLVPSSAFQLALELARAVVAGSLQLPQAERALRDSHPEMSPRAAKGYIGSYVAMRRGTRGFATTIAADAWRLYLADIAQDGAGPLSVALDAFLSHIVYIQGKTNGPEAPLHNVHDEFVGLLKGMAVHEAVLENLDVAVGQSLKASAQERRERLASANKQPEQVVVLTRTFRRNPDVIAEVLLRADGVCEGCGKSAPFQRSDGRPYLEVHHRQRLADGGDDSVENAVALCPNCHRERHHGTKYANN